MIRTPRPLRGRALQGMLRRSVATGLLMALLTANSSASGAVPPGTTRAAASITQATAVSLRPAAPEVRARRAAATRLAEQAAAHAAIRHAEALSLARAAVQAARGAAAVAGASGSADLQQSLDAAGDALAELRAARWLTQSTPAGGQQPDTATDGAGEWASVEARRPASAEEARAMADRAGASGVMVAAQELEEQASTLFALAFQAELPTETSVAELSRVPLAELAEVDSALEAAEAVVTEVVLAPLVPLDLSTETEGIPDWLPVLDLTSGYPNGAIPLDVLCAPSAAPQELLRCDAAEAFDRLAARYLEDTGGPLRLVSTYRTYERQVEVKRLRGSLAATPGTSLHGLGIAIDLADAGGVGQFDTPVYLWMKVNAAEFGWVHPAAMEPGGRGPQEPWHWEFRGPEREVRPDQALPPAAG